MANDMIRFMIADPLFTLAMALNVYLTFFRRYSAEQLRAMDWKYIVFCYGVPFPPALAYLFLKNQNGVRVYGPAMVCSSTFTMSHQRFNIGYVVG